MSDIIQAIVIDGFHKGHVVSLPYQPVIRLLRPTVIMVDTCCGGDEMSPTLPELIEYKECFRGIDRKIVLYSTTGDSTDIKGFFPVEYSRSPWTERTTLYFGYHDGFLKRTDE